MYFRRLNFIEKQSVIVNEVQRNKAMTLCFGQIEVRKIVG